jgi:hypothetical protein
MGVNLYRLAYTRCKLMPTAEFAMTAVELHMEHEKEQLKTTLTNSTHPLNIYCKLQFHLTKTKANAAAHFTDDSGSHRRFKMQRCK